jgi:hypothetical protein
MCYFVSRGPACTQQGHLSTNLAVELSCDHRDINNHLRVFTTHIAQPLANHRSRQMKEYRSRYVTGPAQCVNRSPPQTSGSKRTGVATPSRATAAPRQTHRGTKSPPGPSIPPKDQSSQFLSPKSNKQVVATPGPAHEPTSSLPPISSDSGSDEESQVDKLISSISLQVITTSELQPPAISSSSS